jgi:hypothetical protein
VGADGIDAVAADGVRALHDQVGGIAFQALDQAAIAFLVGGQPPGGGNDIAELILGGGAAAAAAGLGGNEVVHHRVEGSQGNPCDGPEGQQVHELATAHPRHITVRSARWYLGHTGRLWGHGNVSPIMNLGFAGARAVLGP